MRPSQVNAALEAAIVVSVLTGLASWMVGTGIGRILTLTHGLSGLTIAALAPAKIRGPVRTGLRRRRLSGGLSMVFGLLVVMTIGSGVLHSTGLWFGVGEWSALWIHLAAAFGLLPLLVWHVLSRPARLRPVDRDRRLFLGSASAVTAAAIAYGSQEIAVRAAGLAGGRRRFTGSHEIASFDPGSMPRVSWLDDRAPTTPVEDWRLLADREVLRPDDLRERAKPLDAVLDCTGGWWSEQRWQVVPLAELGPAWSGRSVRVTSATGYARWFGIDDLGDVHIAIGYGDEELRRGHGGPLRIVAPGRRGPWWVKWVVSIESSDRPVWWQLPFPPT